MQEGRQGQGQSSVVGFTFCEAKFGSQYWKKRKEEKERKGRHEKEKAEVIDVDKDVEEQKTNLLLMGLKTWLLLCILIGQLVPQDVRVNMWYSNFTLRMSDRRPE